MTNNLKLTGQKGSMMVEALAMLGLIAMVTPVLYKKAAERTTELQDINAAAQMRTISKALDDYIKDNYTDFTIDKTPGYWEVTEDDIKSYLPYGFNLKDSKLFEQPEMAIKRVIQGSGVTAHATLTGIVVSPTSGDLPGIRSAKIASMIGANGSVYKKCAGLDGAQKNQFCGVQGTWFAEPKDYGVTAPKEGSIASISLHAINASSGAGSEHVLFRDNSMGDDSYNRMQTSLLMDGNPIEEVNQLIALGTRGSGEGTANTIEIVGENNASGNLSVTGTGTIEGLLTAGSANIADVFNVTGSGVSSSQKVTVSSGGLDVTGKTTLDETEIDGTATITGALTADSSAEIKGGLTAKGQVSTETVDGKSNVYSLVVSKTAGADSKAGGSLLVENNARVKGSLYIDGEFSANKIYGRTELGGGLISGTNYNFKATASSVNIDRNAFKVGSVLETTDTGGAMGIGTIEVGATNANGAYIQYDGNNYVKATSGNVNAVAGTQAKIQGASSTLTLAGNADLYGAGAATVTAAAGNATVSASGTAVLESPSSSVKAGTSSVRLSSGANNRFINLGTDGMAFGANVANNADSAAANYLFVNKDRMALAASGADTLGYNSNKFTNGVLDDGVLIRREGMITLPTKASVSGRTDLPTGQGKQDIAGYVKLDRIVANQTYPYSGTANGAISAGNPRRGSAPYDAYQVNPAYTSVMHDIKLTTRGNARLSDILPDFINKGIYVIDNTYDESTGSKNWESYVVSKSGSALTISNQPSECSGSNKANCITTPWLGFVPTPQCPPGYSKVITINPIRWKMAEAYSVAMTPTGSNWDANRFKAFFIAPRDPFKARFELSSVDGSSGSHTHSVPAGYGMPLTFQTNTWLNTTIAGVKLGGSASGTNSSSSRDAEFAGWHAIMGFLYHGTDYHDYLAGVGGGNLDGKIVWNLFPVYNEELTAIANVYCYFERRAVTGETFRWNSDLVDTGYNQLTNFRTLTSDKDGGAYEKRLDDPALGYSEPW